jgi:tetratricopeptide (TPR) repeat protein
MSPLAPSLETSSPSARTTPASGDQPHLVGTRGAQRAAERLVEARPRDGGDARQDCARLVEVLAADAARAVRPLRRVPLFGTIDRLDCLDEDTVLAMVDGQLAPERRRAAVDHADACPSCRELIANVTLALRPELAGATVPADRASATYSASDAPVLRWGPTVGLTHGSVFGRYLIIDVVGAGGMGVVYSAYDPELDRRVALKLVRAADGADAGSHRARLVREARAIARVAHPNVVGVHDVGTIDDQVFIAMEFVDGVTLSGWLGAGARTWREKLDVLAQAGRGLAAAHHVGLVHRDFKPDNVLVGRDGRVRVTDFGLARPSGLDAPGAAPSTEPAGDVTLTRTGAFAGTPAYMAPEQMHGHPVDARADVFSFCVAAYEVLFGVRPFAEPSSGHPRPSVQALERAIQSGALAEPKSAAPVRLRAVLARGLAASPSERWPSMDAVLAALLRSQRPRLWVAAIALVAAVALGGWRGWVHLRGQSVCSGAERALAGAWDAPRKQAVRAALDAGGRDDAEAIWRSVESALDGYAASWSRAHTEACEATRVRGEQSEAVLDLRMECLDERRRDLAAFSTLLVSEPSALKHAAEASATLPPIACDDVRALRAVERPQAPPSVLHALRDRLARAQSLRRLGIIGRALDESQAVVREARAQHADAIVAESLTEVGIVEDQQDHRAAAVETLHEAALVAAAIHDDATQADALVGILRIEGYTDFEAARRWSDYAATVTARLDANDWRESARLYGLAAAYWRADQPAEADALARRALARVEHSPHPDPAERAHLLALLGNIADDRGALTDERRYLSDARAILVGLFGERHWEVLRVDEDLADVEDESGDLEAAIRRDRRVLAVYESDPDLRGPLEVKVLSDLGANLTTAGNPREALPLIKRALAMSEETNGKEASATAFALLDLGAAQHALGDPAAAATLERALKLLCVAGRPTSPGCAETELELAQALGGGRRALSLATDARDALLAHPLGPLRARTVAEATAWLAAHGAARGSE